LPIIYHLAQTKVQRLYINLTPLIPLSLRRRGGRFYEEGLMPLLNSPDSVAAGSLARLVSLKLPNSVVSDSFREGALFLNTLV